MKDAKSSFLSLIVPVYNEEQRVHTAFPHVVKFLDNSFDQWEIIYVDDGSIDGTYVALLSIQREFPSVRIIRNSSNSGKGHAVRNGFLASKGELLLFSDADFSTPIEESKKLLESISEGYDIAIGSRGLPKSNVEVRQALGRETMGKVFNLVIRTLLPIEFHDTQCGFKMLSRQAVTAVLPSMQVNRFAFDVEMLIIAQLHGLRIAEVPVTWKNVLESKVHPLRDSFQMLRDVFAIRYRLAMNKYNYSCG